MKTRFLIYFSIIAGLIITSCTDDDKTNFDEFEKTGAFVRFTSENPPANVGVNDISELTYGFSVSDANNNVAMYDLDLYADISGTRTDTVNVADVTSFPAQFNFTASDLAGLLGIDAADINFGDSFFFTARATTNSGVEYFAFEDLDYDDLDDDDPSTFTLEGGGLTNDLIGEAGYRQAFEFNFVILCPDVDLAALVGTYDVVNHRFDAFFGSQGPTREVIAGPGPNQLTIVGGALPLDGADDLIIDVNNDSSLGYGGAGSAIHFNTFGPGTYGSVEGTAFSCIGVLDLTINSEGFIPNFLTLRKQ
ncbi:hypothetical protein U6A24_05445 [Aquimarina gracilis]|uniref:Uncharacterized protein n=1 Tax=Aquimarina gracilis TaxID=874422 RepID=A0ABU5ZS88_9FLAO|nr:hypothetical protein [Aquimarina gracilis]MEB3344893.1 hypothetical protein [Aquimarina gracilis]